MAKYCAKCHAPAASDDARFCTACGSSEFIPAEQPAQPAAPAMPTPAQPAMPAQPAGFAPMNAPAPQQAYAPQPTMAQPGMPMYNQIPAAQPKKKKKTWIVIVAIIAVIALLAGAFFALGLDKKLFRSDKDAFAQAEKNAMSKTVADLADVYDVYMNPDLQGSVYQMKISPVLGSEIKSGLGLNQSELGFLDELEFEVTTNTANDTIASDILVSIGGQHVLTASLFYDLFFGELMVTVPEITDDILSFDLSDYEEADMMGSFDLMSAFGINPQTIAGLLPSSDVMQGLVEKYYGIAVDSVENVTKTSEEVTVEGITQTLTVYQVNISEKTLSDITVNVLEAVKDDAEIEKIVKDASRQLLGGSASVSFDYVRNLIDKQIEQIQSSEVNADNVLLTLYDYVSDGDKLVGRTFEKDDSRIHFVTTEDGGKTATRVTVNDDEFVAVAVQDGDAFTVTVKADGADICSASGTTRDGLTSGEILLLADGETVCTIELTDFDEKGLDDGSFSGKIRIIPNGEAVGDLAPAASPYVSMFQDAALEMEIGGDLTSGTFTLNVTSGTTSIITADVEYTAVPATEPEAPSGAVVYADFDDSDWLNELVGDLHLDQLVANLRNTSVPKEYVDMLDKLSRQMQFRAQS